MTDITQQQLNLFKSLFPNRKDIQELTPEIVQSKADEESFDLKTIRWEDLIQAKWQSSSVPDDSLITITNCQMSIGYVVFDAISLALGAVGLRATVKASTIQAIFNAVSPSQSALEAIIASMSGASKIDQAKGVFNILKLIYNGGSLGAVFSAFADSLTWWDALLYAVSGLATIVAAVATDGVAFVAEVVVLLASFGFLTSDTVKAVQACKSGVALT